MVRVGNQYLKTANARIWYFQQPENEQEDLLDTNIFTLSYHSPLLNTAFFLQEELSRNSIDEDIVGETARFRLRPTIASWFTVLLIFVALEEMASTCLQAFMLIEEHGLIVGFHATKGQITNHMELIR